jgi:glutathione S-transferase
MSIPYIPVEEAIPRRGMRLVVVGKVPSPWGEAAKEIFRLKGIDFAAVRLVYDNEALKTWAGQLSGPVAIYDDEPPRSGWAEILMLAERLAPEPALLSLEPHARGQAIDLANKFCGPNGLGWSRRLQMVHAGHSGTGGFGERIAQYLGAKYGYQAADGAGYSRRVHGLLGEFAGRLRQQREADSPYYLGQALSAVDVYGAAFMALFQPLPEAQCDMHPGARAAFEWLDADTRAALDPILIEHRDMMYSRHLALPLSL